jgi:hypothetical protein
MKKLLYRAPYLIALVPQFIFEYYACIVLGVILIGLLLGSYTAEKSVFGKIFFIEALIFSVVYYTTKERVFYLGDIFTNLGVSTYLVPVLFVIFNALNIAILFFFGYKLGQLFLYRKKL